jgi:site-specific DNA-methyltransferase (adenine-specific)
MGSGSTGKAATLEGFDFTGIEQDENYFEIAKARIKFVRHKTYPEEKIERVIQKNNDPLKKVFG